MKSDIIHLVKDGNSIHLIRNYKNSELIHDLLYSGWREYVPSRSILL